VKSDPTIKFLTQNYPKWETASEKTAFLYFNRFLPVPVGEMAKCLINFKPSPVGCKTPFAHIAHPARMGIV